MSTPAVVESLEVTDPIEDRFDEVPTPRALELFEAIEQALGDALPSGRWDDARALSAGDGRVGRVQRLPDPACLRADAVRTQ